MSHLETNLIGKVSSKNIINARNQMALIKCSECGKEISSEATACPSCGNPIKIQVSKTVEPTKPMEVELTSKKWKKRIAFAIILLLVGWVVCFKSIGWGIFLMFIAFVIGVSARIGAWWSNG